MFFGGGFPFEGMPGGMPGGGGPPADTNEFYETLGVTKDMDCNEINRAWRKAARKHHPDKGGDASKFQAMQEAAEVLTNEEKRKVYDKYGKDGLEGGGGGGGGPTDIFEAMFGGGGGPRRQQRRQVAPIEKQVEVSLEDLYCGRTFNLDIPRQRMCSDCQGTGSSRPELDFTCNECNGHGFQVIRRQIAPGFHQQVKAKCGQCEGEGSYVPKKFQCKGCNGKKLKKDVKTFKVEIQKGMKNQDKVVFRGEGHAVPDVDPGDVVVHLQSAKHSSFIRKGDDLLHEFKVSLAEALDPAAPLALKHLDDRMLTLNRPEGHIIKPGGIMKVSEEGMPFKSNPFQKGDLYLRFNIVFPEVLPDETVAALRGLLAEHSPALNKVADEGDNKAGDDDMPWVCSMTPVDIKNFGAKSRREREAYGSDDSEDEGIHGGPGGVQCQQM